MQSIVHLVTKRFFDNTPCHRPTTSAPLSVLQCGDPTGSGTGGPGYSFADEYPTNQLPARRSGGAEGRDVPARLAGDGQRGPRTNGSQFFLVYKDSQLPPDYTVFGKIDDTGLATLDKIAAAGVEGGGQDGKPAAPVTVKSIGLD